MIRNGLLLLLSCLTIFPAVGQHTFSIVAVDPNTGEVGSAGATCLDDNDVAGGAIIISDVIPGRGAINTQSFWLAANQQNARARMLAGDSPQDIITWVTTNDVQGDASQRQYGVADLDSLGQPRTGAFTGNNCLDEKSHRVGSRYAIQGNVLINNTVLDSMQAGFLTTSGSLADKLMGALQGANIPGADSRCLSEGVSSRSAFIRVARPNDPDGGFYLDLLVSQTPFGEEPIDSLQVLFDQWSNALSVQPAGTSPLPSVKIYPQPALGQVNVDLSNNRTGNTYTLEWLDITGRTVSKHLLYPGVNILEQPGSTAGYYFYALKENGRVLKTGKTSWGGSF